VAWATWIINPLVSKGTDFSGEAGASQPRFFALCRNALFLDLAEKLLPSGQKICMKPLENIIISACGAATSLLTALLLFGIERFFGFSFYTWIFWFVIPVGALFSGLVASTGYYCGARLFNHRPSRGLLLNILLVAVGCFFLIHYLGYYYLNVDGIPLRTRVAFGSYLQMVLEHTSLSFRVHASVIGSTGELGTWGYAYALLQILGFAVGGCVVYILLLEHPFCAHCERYLKRVDKVQRFSESTDLLDKYIEQVRPLLEGGRLAEALAKHNGFGDADENRKKQLRTELSNWQCPRCAQNVWRLAFSKRLGSGWMDMPKLKLEGTIAGAGAVVGPVASGAT
jgi:hypothetical protein